MRSPKPIGRSIASRVQPGRRKSTCGRSRNRSEARKDSRCNIRAARKRVPTENSTEKTAKEKNMGKLEGKIALITGGNGGIGLAASELFLDESAAVLVTCRRDP